MKIPETVPWRSTGVTLGSGGQGQVHLVTRKGDPSGDKFALKALRYVDSEQARQRFKREIEAVKKLTDAANKPTNSAIVRIVDHSKLEDKFQYYVMEYHECAQPLSKIIFSSCNPFHGNALKSLGLFEQVVSAIGECEVADPVIVHRDIKPQNILVLPDDTIRLIDFGICHFQDGEMITLTDENVGPRNYTAPECESGIDASIGIHSDLYSAAKVLWSAVTSKQAFAREQPVFTNRAMKQMFPVQTDTWHLTRIFEKTIRENPDDRCRTTRRVLQLIHEIRNLVQEGFPPLEDIPARCPSCGRRNLTDFPEAHLVFGISRPPEKISTLVCKSCGFAFVRNYKILQENLEDIENLS